MPIYEYSCNKCDNVQEEFHGMNENPTIKCSECGGRTDRVISVCGWNLEGEGWYNPHNPMRSGRGGVPGTHKKKTK